MLELVEAALLLLHLLREDPRALRGPAQLRGAFLRLAQLLPLRLVHLGQVRVPLRRRLQRRRARLHAPQPGHFVAQLRRVVLSGLQRCCPRTLR